MAVTDLSSLRAQILKLAKFQHWNGAALGWIKTEDVLTLFAGVPQQPCPHCKLPAVLPPICTPEINAVLERNIARDGDLFNKGYALGKAAVPQQQTCRAFVEDEHDPQWNLACCLPEGHAGPHTHKSGAAVSLHQETPEPVLPICSLVEMKNGRRVYTVGFTYDVDTTNKPAGWFCAVDVTGDPSRILDFEHRFVGRVLVRGVGAEALLTPESAVVVPVSPQEEETKNGQARMDKGGSIDHKGTASEG